MSALTLVLASTPLWSAGAGASVSAGTPVARSQRLVILRAGHEAMSQPSNRSTDIQALSTDRPITGEATTLPVIGDKTTGGATWLHVQLPGRPNGRTGWIRRADTTTTTTGWHVVVHTAPRRVIVYLDGIEVRTFEAIVGKSSTPSPAGTFFVEEDVRLRKSDVGAPFALALSARSNVLQEFDGGPGQIAIHGLGNVGGTLGTAVSHGCVRLDASAMSWLVARIGPGVPVTVTS
ncbi:MAG: ErfK/YbiS/YcfS/YnhG family protein [Acidimicrobiaceae bacterium]|nr:ErfK/YbiS/YcfS/YnhG family protein [Acidimicrobiaceae bacterium]